MELGNYKKCKYCNADMSFNPSTGRLVCKHCGRAEWIYSNYKVDLKPVKEIPIGEIKKKSKQREFLLDKRKVHCENCEGVVEYRITDNTFICPYCGSHMVSEKTADDILRPDGVVPFKVKEKEARSAFNRKVTGSLFYPVTLKAAAKKSKIKGVYIPVWTYDAPVYARCKGSYVRKLENGKKTTVSFDETINLQMDDQLAVANDKYDLSRIKEIEPFMTERNKPYKPEYVVGFESELQTIPVEKAWEKESVVVEDKMRKKAIRLVKIHFYGNKKIQVDSVDIQFGELTCKHLFIPVWISELAYKNNDYYYIVNGENGKVAGDLPYTYNKIYALIAAGIVALLLLIRYAKFLLILVGGIVVLLILFLWIIWVLICAYIKSQLEDS